MCSPSDGLASHTFTLADVNALRSTHAGRIMPIPQRLLERVETFQRNLESYTEADYKEARLREEFLNPLFEELGWDMTNRKGYAELYKDVVHEDTLKLSGVNTSAPDYSFRIGGTRKFFVEAKKPAVRIKDDPAPAAQLRRYSWSAKLPLGIVTDFQEFAIYDTRIRPREGDKAPTSRIFYCTHDQYPEKWDEIAAIFSREAVLKGSFDKYAATSRGKRGTAEFDDEFLKDMENWRELLARNLALRNSGLSQRELNFAVQRILDRIIFLRIAEDRGIEPYGQLQALTAGPRIYPRLCEICERADYRYNSGLFHFAAEKGREEAPDRLTLGLELDDATIKEILSALYYPKCPYAFAVIPADILGHVYEKFLGKVIHLTAGHQARVEEKPEVRKAGGVYYTPTYIVDYIVAQTVGSLLGDPIAPKPSGEGGSSAKKSLTPAQVSKLRILDPACGSGSFLLGAFEFLLDWHLKYYIGHDPDGWAKKKHPPIYETAPNAFAIGSGSKNWQLTTAERKRILLANIHGVDIDAQAVEVTKLSLLLKVLEGEARELRGRQLDFHRVLPDLSRNIKCGNSLIGSDFYQQAELPLLDDEARIKINAFDWQHEFKDIMDSGGFDAVIGNPPYVRMEGFVELKGYLRAHYSSHEERSDLYGYFIERGIRLLKVSGRIGMIVSNKFAAAKYGFPLRQTIMSLATIETIADLAGAPVFRGATVRTLVLVAARGTSTTFRPATYVPVPRGETWDRIASRMLSLSEWAHEAARPIKSSQVSDDPWRLSDGASASLVERLTTLHPTLEQSIGGRPLFGIKTGLNRAFIIGLEEKREMIRQSPNAEQVIYPILFGKDSRRFLTLNARRFIIYLHPNRDVSEFPSVEKHLQAFRSDLLARATKQQWFELQQPAVGLIPILQSPKIVYPIIAPEPRFSIDRTGFLINDKTFVLPTDSPAVLV